MPNILQIQDATGTNPIPRETRNGVDQQNVKTELTYSDQGGEGITELVFRNISPNNTALEVEVTHSRAPFDSNTSKTLIAQWDFQPVGSTSWNGAWAQKITIPEIPPGEFCRVRTRTLGSASSEPTTHLGAIDVKYKRSSV